MHVVHQEDAVAETGKRLLHSPLIEFLSGTGRGSFQSFKHSRLVALRLQSSDEPGAGIGQPLIVEIDGVLGGEDDAKSKGACLFEQRHQRQFGRRIGDRGEIAEDLIHIKEGSQARRP